MKVDRFQELVVFVKECTEEAINAAEKANLSKFADCLQESRERSVGTRKSKSLSLLHDAEYQEREIYYCEKCWAVMLSVDIRNSSKRAMKIGPKDTFVTMHVFMRAMLRLVANANGIVVGLRGDGLLGAFGRKKYDKEDELKITEDEGGNALIEATSCGGAMIQAVQEIINPALAKRGILGDLHVGVGVECGRMIITKIGLLNAFDLTSYGDCVNMAAKISSEKSNINKVVLGRKARDNFPRSDKGKIKFSNFGLDMFAIDFPKGSSKFT